jgi:hypothetical protein
MSNVKLLVAENPRAARGALATARKYEDEGTKIPVGQCDHFVGVWYGYDHTGELTAAQHWFHIPKAYRLGDQNTQHGALAFFIDPQSPESPGHVAMINGTDFISHPADHPNTPKEYRTILSTDAPHGGAVGIVPIWWPIHHWGMQLLGIAQPYFPHGVTLNPRRVPWHGTR